MLVGQTSRHIGFQRGISINNSANKPTPSYFVVICQHILDAIETRRWLPGLILLFLFLFGILGNVNLPGLYFDAVNPDYLAAKILAGNQYISHFPPWDAFPVLGNYYHGAMHTYFGLAFFNLFGFSVLSLRMAHAIFGLGILLLSNQVLARATGSRLFSLLVTGIMALDPAFIFAFRTQAYITLSPLLFLLASSYLLLVIRSRIDAAGSGSRYIGPLTLSGFLAGWAFYGYFIYIFFVPAFIVIVVHLSRVLDRSWLRMIICWLAAFTLGAFLYFIGYGMLWAELGGPSEILERMSVLRIAGNSTEFLDRPNLLFQHVVASLAGNFQWSVMFDHASHSSHGVIKSLVLISLLAMAVLIAVVRRRMDASLGYVMLLVTSYLVVLFVMAGRIAPHHTVPLLPLLYLAAGLSLHRAGLSFSSDAKVLPSKAVSATSFALVLFLVVLNLQHQGIFQERLVSTGGVKYYSDSQTLLAQEARQDPNPPYYVFGEWGFIGSFAFLTAGEVAYNSSMDEWAIGLVPCTDELAILFWGQENSLVESFANTQGLVTGRRVYYQRDGTVAFTELRVSERTNCSQTDTYPNF